MKLKIYLSFIALILSIIAQSCSSISQVQAETHQNTIKAETITMSPESRLSESNTKFALNLFTEIVSENNQENIFISPSSVAIALAMLHNGANSTTQTQMLRSLQLEGLSVDEVNQANQLLRESLMNADPKVQLAIANSLWMREGFSFKPEFIDINEKFYQSEAKTLNFNHNESLNIINNWVKDNTKGKINQIIDEILPEDVMFLINAIYFKGDWSNKFDQNKTKLQPFYLEDQQSKTVSMMSRFGSYKYQENERFQSVSLPYGEEKRLTMYIFLPKKYTNLEKFSQVLNFENWSDWMEKFNYKEGTVEMPRFQLEYELELNSVLKKLGMDIIFNPEKADFSNLSENPVYIDTVKHKTYLEVNEEGTEAAAVTSIGVRATSINLDEPFTMKIDRPFFCVIKDEKTETILFMGAIYNP
jgi:serpin B